MSQDNNHDEWLSLIEISGPFLAVPVLKKAFPQGLEAVDGRVRKYLCQAYDEWCEARDNDDPQLGELHHAWIREVLARGLEYDEKDSGELLKLGEAIPATLHIALPEHGVTLSPDYALVNGHKALLLIQTYPADTDLDAAISQQGWAATPAERLVQLCRTTGCRLGLITNGERWLLIDAPIGSVVTYASWYARLWGQEPLTLQAFLTLLGIRRFFVDASEQLPALLDESLQHQEEVTDALGEQVRRAVEVLIQSLDKEDLNSARTLLQDVTPTQLYEAGLTIMMRLVFLLSAEERGLLLMGDEAYEANYAISTLRMQLRKESDEVLERRHDAWARLLATFRAVYGGVEHETLRLPALGGSLFDPDRFPFLEGRSTGSSWRTDDARPLPIDNRTVLLLLEAIQQYQGRTLSYRALDVEQIGYVYEGLLERTVQRTDAVTVELVGGKGAKKTIYALSELEALRGRDEDEFTRQLASSDALKRSESAVRKDLARVVDAALTNHLLTACHGDEALRDSLLPIANLLRTDPWGYPLVYAKGAFIVTTGSDRRETGTHYTPKSLTEAIVVETLTPVAYVGPVEGALRDQWALKSPAELLDLKICDPAMGSGAFLVQACRWLSDRLVEAWSQVESLGQTVSVDGEVLEAGAAKEPLPRDSEARTVIARRLIAERCLYGVDLNPLAVELAKLSIWLVTLAKGRPFGFLDHNLRCGDSLLGIHRLDQLTELSMTPTGKGQQRLFGQNIVRAVSEAIELRQQLRKTPIRDIHDVEGMARLDADARSKLEVPEHIADAFIGAVLESIISPMTLENKVASLSVMAGQAVAGDQFAAKSLFQFTVTDNGPNNRTKFSRQKPFHWVLQFPEVFSNGGGFDACIGNPPFLGGTKLEPVLGRNYREYLVNILANGIRGERGAGDLAAYFFNRSFNLLSKNGCAGLIASNSISQGDTKAIGLELILQQGGTIYKAESNRPWPGKAQTEISMVWLSRREFFSKPVLDSVEVLNISAQLQNESDYSMPKKLAVNSGLAFEGAKMIGDGFILSEDEGLSLLDASEANRDVIWPYLSGKDINSRSDCYASRYAINFWDWPLEREGGHSGAVAEDFPECLDIVRERVRPFRMSKPNSSSANKVMKDKWWLYYLWRPAMYAAIKELDRVLVRSRVSNKHALAFVSTKTILSDATVVFALDGWEHFGILQSNIHEVWLLKFSSTMRNDVRYTPTSCFQTFPWPDRQNKYEEVALCAKSYYLERSALLKRENCGLTDLYGKFHKRTEQSSEIKHIRTLHSELDQTVALAYGWNDLDLAHGFHQTWQGERFTISESARLEIFRRLFALNHAHFENETAIAMHVRADSKGEVAFSVLRGAGQNPNEIQGELFDEEHHG